MITEHAGPLGLERAGGCERLATHSARCWMAKQVRLDLNDGDDVATIATKRVMSMNGGAGNDRYNAVGTDRPSRVDGVPFEGRPGDDDWIDRTVETVFGSLPADVLTGSRREQRLFGFEGDDTLAGGPASARDRRLRRGVDRRLRRGPGGLSSRYAASVQERCRSG